MSNEIQKGQVFKLATEAGKLAWNSSSVMSNGTPEEQEVYQKTISEKSQQQMADSPEWRLAKMVQTVMEADMRGLSTDAVVENMRKEGARLGLVDTEVDTVLGLAADAYATKAATRNPEFFDDGIHERLMNRAFNTMAAMHGHEMVEATKSMHVIDYANYASAYSNQREVLAEAEVVKTVKSPEVDHIQKSLKVMETAYKEASESPQASKVEAFTAGKRETDIADIRKTLDKPNPEPSMFKKLGNLLGNTLDNMGTKLMQLGGLDTKTLTTHVENIVESVKTLGHDISRPVSDFLERAKGEEQKESRRDDSAMRPD